MKYQDNWDESFEYQEKKEQRKARAHARARDRSQFKKSDLEQRKRAVASYMHKEGILEGRVVAILPEGVVVDHQGKELFCWVRGAWKKDNLRTKNFLAVGDFVRFDSDRVIDSIKERRSILSRAEHFSRNTEQIIAVNIDQVLIMSSLSAPQLKPALIDRYIIAANKGNMIPVIVLNKLDLLHEEERPFLDHVVKLYRALQIAVFPISVITGEGIEALREMMKGKASVISGQSGVGKTALLNRLTGNAFRTGNVVARTLKGSHTTSTARLVPLREGGFCIDTPGIRSFGIWELGKEEIAAYFPEISLLGSQCRFPNCHHLEEPGCAVKEAVEKGQISSLRFASYCALMSERKSH
jgi:ribosome biogenesis GTPase